MEKIFSPISFFYDDKAKTLAESVEFQNIREVIVSGNFYHEFEELEAKKIEK